MLPTEAETIISVGVIGVDDFRADIQLSSAQNQRSSNDPNKSLIDNSSNSG